MHIWVHVHALEAIVFDLSSESGHMTYCNTTVAGGVTCVSQPGGTQNGRVGSWGAGAVQ